MDFSIKLIFVILLIENTFAINSDNSEGNRKQMINNEKKLDKTGKHENIFKDSNRVKIESNGMDSEEEDITRGYKKTLKQLPTTLKLKDIKESMDKDTACCMLGQIAGDKGYHCHAIFYSYDIMQRNTNRAHNKKLSFYGRDRMPHFGEKLMFRFANCMEKKSFIFNKCCQMSAKERENLFGPQYNTIQHYLYNLNHKQHT